MAKAGWNFENVAASFCEAAIDPSYWCKAMEIAAEESDACGAIMFPVRGRLPALPHTESLDASFENYLVGGWVHRDQRYRALPTVARRGLATELDFTTPGKMLRDPYYQEFLRPHKLRWSALVKVAAGDEFWILSLQRTIEQGPFQPSELVRLKSLSSALGSAAALAKTLGEQRQLFRPSR